MTTATMKEHSAFKALILPVLKRLNSTEYLRRIWKREAGALPPDAPSYVKELGQRVLWLIADIEQQEGEFEQIRKILEPQ